MSSYTIMFFHQERNGILITATQNLIGYKDGIKGIDYEPDNPGEVESMR